MKAFVFLGVLAVSTAFPHNHDHDQSLKELIKGKIKEKIPEEVREKIKGKVAEKFGFGSADSETEMMEYEVLEKHDSYEHRRYGPMKFVCTKQTVDVSDDPLANWREDFETPFAAMGSKLWKQRDDSGMFRKLFKFIIGRNSEGAEVEMTRPVFTRATHDDLESSEYEMCFWLGSPWQDKEVPQPLDEDVYIKETPQMEYFARRFGGFAISNTDWTTERDALMNDLADRADDMKDPDIGYYLGYNSPFTTEDRRNEVLVEAKMNLEEDMSADVDSN